MALLSPRFTIGSLMIAVAIIAGVLGLHQLLGGNVFVTLVGVCYLGLFGVWWRVFRGFRRLAALWLAITAALGYFTSVLCSIYSPGFGVGVFTLVWLAAFPLVLGAGFAWAIEATRPNSSRRRSQFLAWPLAIGLAVSPMMIAYTLMPLWVAFRVSRSALESLADRVSAGQVLTEPAWAGIIHVVGSAVDPASGNIGLIVEFGPSGRAGFVRVGRGIRPEQNRAPFYNLSLIENLEGRWSFQCED